MTMRRCYWCGRFGAALTTYQLSTTTTRYVRWLCPSDAAHCARWHPLARELPPGRTRP